MWRKGNPHTLLVRIQICAVTMENGMEAPQKIKTRTTIFQPNYPMSGYLFKEYKDTNSKRCLWTSLVVQWLIICLAMHGTLVRSLVREASTCCWAPKPVYHSY